MSDQDNKDICLNLSSQEIKILEKGQSTPWVHFSQKKYEDLENSFAKISEFFGALPHYDFVQTESLEEGLSQVVKSHYQRHMFPSGKCHVLAFPDMPSAYLQALGELKLFGVDITFAKLTENGLVDLKYLKSQINPRTSLISVMWAHPITGIIQPLHEIAEICKIYDIAFHVDMTGSVGQLDMPMKDSFVDYLTFSHEDQKEKFFSGVIAKPLMQLMPLIQGYGIQKLRGGDFDQVKLHNFVRSLESLKENLYDRILEKASLKKKLISLLKNTFAEVKVLFEDSETLPSTLVVSWDKLHSEYLGFLLFEKKIKVNLGGYRFPSLKNILLEMGSKLDIAQGAVSLNLDELTSQQLPKFVEALMQIQETIKKGAIA